jgi:hypothetical protein
MLQLVDRLVVKIVDTLHEITILVSSWEYTADFLIINPRSGLDGHPLIVGRPWLATTYAYIGCHTRNMKIGRGGATNNLILYPPTKPRLSIIHQ